MAVFDSLSSTYHERRDAQPKYEVDESDEWFLTRSPVPVAVVLATYLFFVLHLGPRWMVHRRAYPLNGTMLIYNVLQVAFNLGMCYKILTLKGAVVYHITHMCVPVRVEEDLRYSFHLFSWCYLVSKIFDLLDTVFMVLKKKQPTFLHVYHHVSMVAFTWISIKYIKAQQGAPPAVLNMFVHVVMYSYYLLASLGPRVRPYLWWKRYITKLQLGQFLLVILYLAYLHLNSCYVSQLFNLIWIINVTVIAAFFVNFYINTYCVNKKTDNK